MTEKIEAMQTGETMNVNGFTVKASMMRNGKRKFIVTSSAGHELANEPRTAKQVIALIQWAKKKGH